MTHGTQWIADGALVHHKITALFQERNKQVLDNDRDKK
jgi:hypothetical protein